jgi:hypothetical protein
MGDADSSSLYSLQETLLQCLHNSQAECLAAMHPPGGQDGGAMGTAVPAAINKALAMHFPSPNTRIIGEPGRYMVQDAATIACAINGVRPRHAVVRVQACMGQIFRALTQHSVV